MFKKKINAVPVLDLRSYTPEALSKIKSISAVALLLLPENPSAEFINAYSKIKISAVAITVNASPEKKITTFNGATIISGKEVKDSICLCNGLIFIHSVSEDDNAEFVFNGLVVKQTGSEVKNLAANGRTVEWDFEASKVKMNITSLDVNMQFIENCEEGTIISTVDTITIDDDVTYEAITERNIRFVAVNKIICNKSIYGCVAGRSVVVNKVEVKE